MRKIVTKKYERYRLLKNVESSQTAHVNEIIDREHNLRKCGYRDEANEAKNEIKRRNKELHELRQRIEQAYQEAYDEAFDVAAIRCLVYAMAYITYGYAFSLKCLLNERCADDAGEAEYAKRVQDSCGALMEMATEFGIIGGRDNESFNNIEEMVTERADPFVRELMNEITFAAGNENIQIKKLMEKYGKR